MTSFRLLTITKCIWKDISNAFWNVTHTHTHYIHDEKKLTWESYIKALIAHGKVWYKAKLNTEVPKEACFHTGGQHWASESSNGLLEIAVLDDGKVIVILLQMERVEHQMDTWKSAGGWCMIERTDTELEAGSEIVFTPNGLRELNGNKVGFSSFSAFRVHCSDEPALQNTVTGS